MDVLRDEDCTAPEVPGYDVGRLLGRGGTAAVWLVTERATGREFALKCFDSSDDATEEDGGARALEDEEALRREVRILSALDHEHLLKAHTVLRFRGPGSGPEAGDALGLVLEYAAGGSVAELVAGRGRLAAGETVTVLTPIAQALEYLHSRGFTHGDVSPGNVLFTAHGKPLLADVGVARMVADAGSAGGAGTEGFSDPAPVDAVRAGLQPERDVYSLAALGWYCLTGRPPVPGARRPPLPILVPAVPPALARALEAGLDEDRRRRPTAAELAAAVYRSTAAEPVDLSVTAHPTVVPQLLTRRTVPRNARERRAERLHGWLRRWPRGRQASMQKRAAGAATILGPGASPDPGRLPGAGPFGATGGAADTALDGAPPPMTVPGAHSKTSPVAARHAATGGTARHSAAGPWPGSRSDRTADAGHLGADPAVDDAWNGTREATRHGAGDGSRQNAGRVVRQVAGPVGRRGTLVPGRRRGRRKLWAGPAIAVVLLAALGVARLPGGAGLPELFAGSHPSASAGLATPGAGADAIPAGLRDSLGSADPVEAVRGLAALRSQAFRSGKLGLLAEVNVPGSDAAAADARIAAPLAKTGHVLSGFDTVLTSVQAAPEASPGRTVVAVTASSPAYQERDAAGAVVAEGPADGETRLRLVLVSVDGRWRIAEILAGSPGSG
jgi:hypothetical protein